MFIRLTFHQVKVGALAWAPDHCKHGGLQVQTNKAMSR
jgi:hypothetical protein